MILIGALIAPVALILGCAPGPGTSTGRDSGPPADGGSSAIPTITVSGRVVDFESCFEGCDGVSDVVVAWAGAPEALRSEPSGADGSFVVAGVPSGFRSDLMAIPGAGQATRFATTLNAMALSRDDTADVFSLQVVVMPRDSSSIIAAFEDETDMRLDRDGGYIGQVVNINASGGYDAAPGIDVAHAPNQGTIRYLNVVPRLAPAEDPFQPVAPGTATSIFGVFVLGGSGAIVDPVTFAPGTPAAPYGTIVTPLFPGVVSYGLHVAR
ncbi:MAG: hypothetical protein DRJ42_10925 [Deltaproteobacteria bacterium]|nr:MAG: hypothetical protein DRJ42_10925 [Deltaproteobacteria bacterium]